MNTMGKRIKFAREHALSGWMSQRALGEKVGTSQQNIAKLEKDGSQETAYLIRIAIATGYRAEWLETGKEPKTAEAARYIPPIGTANLNLTPPLSPRQQAVLDLFDGLTPEQQDATLHDLEATQRRNAEIYEALSRQRKAG